VKNAVLVLLTLIPVNVALFSTEKPVRAETICDTYIIEGVPLFCCIDSRTRQVCCVDEYGRTIYR
jgi:hypothetical protein